MNCILPSTARKTGGGGVNDQGRERNLERRGRSGRLPGRGQGDQECLRAAGGDGEQVGALHAEREQGGAGGGVTGVIVGNRDDNWSQYTLCATS